MSLLTQVFSGILLVTKNVFLALFPIVLLFLILNFTAFKLTTKKFWQLMEGFFFTFIGLVLFMQGVEIAYVPIGKHLGKAFAHLPNPTLLVFLGFFMGLLVGLAEPAIHVMVRQVEEITVGRIKSKIMLWVVALGVGLAVGLSMWRLLAGFSLYYFLIPGYLLVFLLGRKVDPFFLALSFDNGGVATGPMCSTFILAMSVAVASYLPGRDPILDGFGVVALIALAPIVSTLILGYIYKTQENKRKRQFTTSQKGAQK